MSFRLSIHARARARASRRPLARLRPAASSPAPSPRPFRSALALLITTLAGLGPGLAPATRAQAPAFINFETAPVNPIALSPDGSHLAVCNLADGRLELFTLPDAPALPIPAGSVPVGLDPVTVRFRTATEAWVVNHISDSISVVDVPSRRVMATLATLDGPADVVFAGNPVRAFVSCPRPNTIQVVDPGSRQTLTNVVIAAERPRNLAVSPDGSTVYAAIFESGNGTTIVGGTFENGLFFDNVVGLTNAPSGGRNPAPNDGTQFSPGLNPAIPASLPAPGSGLIVRRTAAGRWLDGNQGDWTEFVSGTNAALTHRVAGWDLADRDVAALDTATLGVRYAGGLMNICMALAVQPGSGRITLAGTEARNDVRFEPNLNGIFVEVRSAQVAPGSFAPAPGPAPTPPPGSIHDLNPHLDYQAPTLPEGLRDQSIGDPRAIVWSADGTRAWVAGMGSRNVVTLDANGQRTSQPPIEVGEGPCGLALDEPRSRLYVFHRFSSSLSVIHTGTDTVIGAIPLFDPTPLPVAAGRRHLYDTRRTSGLGQAACASCHVDGRLDRLAWDLGNPAGDISTQILNQQGTAVTNTFHPMKGVMVTQTLQDIIGHEPFHWRGDKPDIESFNGTYTNLQGAPLALDDAGLAELRAFLASVRLPPNPFRGPDNALPTSLPLPEAYASGSGPLPAGTPLPPGNAVAGITAFTRAANFCQACHSLPTGLGPDALLENGVLKPIPPGPNDAHHFPVAFRLEGPLRSKIAQFRNLADRLGMTTREPLSRAGFGFGHDGSIDSLTRLLNGLRVADDQEIADLSALLLAVSGADLATPGGVPDRTPPAGVGRQFTVDSTAQPPPLDLFLSLARSATSRVDLVVHGQVQGSARGWWFDRDHDRFQSDRQAETSPAQGLLALAAPGQELTFTLVARGTGRRLGIDRDLDGRLNRDELDAGSNPADPLLRPAILAASTDVPVGFPFRLEAQLPPLPAPGRVAWWKDGQPIPGETNRVLTRPSAIPADAGHYTVRVTTPFQSMDSLPFALGLVPLRAAASPATQSVRQGSNATWQAVLTGTGPFTHQWLFEGRPLPGATAASLVVSNVQLANEGRYQVMAANTHGSVTSAPVQLGVLIPPTPVIAPVSQAVPEGSSVTLSAQIAGHPAPFGYSLRRSATLVTQAVSSNLTVFFTLANVTTAAAGTYRIVVTNAANPSPGLTLGPISLSVLTDADRDGLPDSWEAARGLSTNNAADAALDPDGDTLSTAEEYLAGTDPFDPLNVLRLTALPTNASPPHATAAPPAIALVFQAVSNRTYTVQQRVGNTAAQSPAATPGWVRFADVAATATNRVVTLPVPANTNAPVETRHSYFRLVTPRLPDPP